jgi:hypothetical protein
MNKKYRFQVPVYYYYEAEADSEDEALDKISLKKIKPSMIEDEPNWADAVEVGSEQ